MERAARIKCPDCFPHSHHDLFYNEDTQVLGIVTGIGTAKSASAIMALGLDSRLDLSNAYWIISRNSRH